MIDLKHAKLYAEIAGGFEEFTILDRPVSKPARPISEGVFDDYVAAYGAIVPRRGASRVEEACEYIGIAEPYNGAGEVRYMMCGALSGEVIFVPAACGMTRAAWECEVSIFSN